MLKHVSALRPLALHCVSQKRRVLNSCSAYLHPLRIKVPLFHITTSVAGLQTVGMASSCEESGVQCVKSEDRLEVNPEEGRGRTTSSGVVCHEPGRGVVQQEGGEELGQGEQEGSVGDYQQMPHELNQGREGLLLDDEMDGSQEDDGHQEGEGVEWEDQNEEGVGPSSGHGREKGSDGDGGGGAGPVDIQQSVKAEAVAAELIPHGKFTSEIYKIEVRNLPKVGFAVSLSSVLVLRYCRSSLHVADTNATRCCRVHFTKLGLWYCIRGYSYHGALSDCANELGG